LILSLVVSGLSSGKDSISKESNEDFKKIYPRFAGQVMQQGQKIYQAFVDAGLMKIIMSASISDGVIFIRPASTKA
jgi:hypothetical protein